MEFLQIWVRDVASLLEVRIKRDLKYARALRGELRGLTGLDGEYEEPENPELILDTDKALRRKLKLF